MADTRCSNPAYQLDVDVMMLEYTLHTTLSAQFEALAAIHTAQIRAHDVNGNSTNLDVDLVTKAERLIQIFENLLQLFHIHHPGHDLEPGTMFNMKILEFLILLARLHDTSDQNIISADMRRQLFKLASQYVLHRQHWLQARVKFNPGLGLDVASSSKTTTITEKDNRIYESWRSRHSSCPAPFTVIVFANLLPRFMEISAELAGVMGEINEKWMDLTGRLMLHAALEVVSVNNGSDLRLPGDTCTGLADCFAWGYNDPSSYTTDHDSNGSQKDHLLETDQLINDMFRDKSSSNGAPTENRLWTTTRHHYLDHFLLPSSLKSVNLTNAELRERRMDKLKHQFPFTTLLKDLGEYMKKIWEVNWTLSGLPVLVQIERGKGLTIKVADGKDQEVVKQGVQMDEFLDRCGVRLPS